jgi:hypothetical protein
MKTQWLTRRALQMHKEPKADLTPFAFRRRVLPALRFGIGLALFLIAGRESSASAILIEDVLVQIRATSGGFPTSTVLTSGTISGGSIPYGFSPIVPLTHVNFSSAISVTAGQQLALLFFDLSSTSHVNVDLQNGAADPYAGGQAVIFASGAWVPATTIFLHLGFDDWFFRTYVNGAIDQEAGPGVRTNPPGPGTFEASVQPLILGDSYGQTFTVGRSGLLQGADLLLDQFENPPVPEPGSLLLLGSGLALFAHRGKRLLARRR